MWIHTLKVFKVGTFLTVWAKLFCGILLSMQNEVYMVSHLFITVLLCWWCNNIFLLLPLGMMAELQQMNLSLERIQKALDMFLETKRMIFPRFYFISNDDLLEILGNTKNPENIQPHMKKLFDNIKSLKITCVSSL